MRRRRRERPPQEELLLPLRGNSPSATALRHCKAKETGERSSPLQRGCCSKEVTCCRSQSQCVNHVPAQSVNYPSLDMLSASTTKREMRISTTNPAYHFFNTPKSLPQGRISRKGARRNIRRGAYQAPKNRQMGQVAWGVCMAGPWRCRFCRCEGGDRPRLRRGLPLRFLQSKNHLP